MQFRIYYDIKLTKDSWINLYTNNPKLTPFQSYEWNLAIQTRHKQLINKIKRILKKISIRSEFWVFKDKESDVIAPLIINETEKSIFIFGQQDMSDYLSFIYNDKTSIEFLYDCFVQITHQYKDYQIHFDRINEVNSKMIEFCKLLKPYKVVPKKCVKIKIIKDLLSSVNSDARRYYKQAVKRIENDNSITLFKSENRIFTSTELDFLRNHYRERTFNKFKVPKGRIFLNSVKNLLVFKNQAKDDLVSSYFLNKDDGYLFSFYINNELGAYMLCDLKDETMYVLRISINDNYASYRPGILLIVETLNHLSTLKENVLFLDFTRGDESYKLNYGGIINLNFYFICN